MNGRPLRFAVAGGIGFVTDAAVLVALLALTGLDPFTARLIAIAMALTVTWSLNRAFTFGKSGRHVVIEGMRYGGVGVTASLANYLAYAGLILTLPEIRPLVALVIASAAAMAFSYTGYARFVFR